jgi:hypothetical protein
MESDCGVINSEKTDLYINNQSKLNSDMKEYTTQELNQIRMKIENMNTFNQTEVLRILHDSKEVVLNENNYGVHINLSELRSEIVSQLVMYINYVNTQENTLGKVEQQKEKLQNIYFGKDNKDNEINKL